MTIAIAVLVIVIITEVIHFWGIEEQVLQQLGFRRFLFECETVAPWTVPPFLGGNYPNP